MAILKVQLPDGTIVEYTRGAAERLVKQGKAVYFAGGAVDKPAALDATKDVGEAQAEPVKATRKRGGE